MELFLLGGVEVESELGSESIFPGRSLSRSWSHLKSVDSAALIGMKLTGLCEVISAHKMRVPEFLSWRSKVRSILWHITRLLGNMEMLPVSHNLTETPNSFRIMTTHPICDDRGATDDRGSREGHLRSHEVTIRFSPITRNRMEIEMRKWCQTTWLVKPLWTICILTFLGHDLTLAWPDPQTHNTTEARNTQYHRGQILKLTF